MKYLILTIAILVMACENEQRQMPVNDDWSADDLTDNLLPDNYENDALTDSGLPLNDNLLSDNDEPEVPATLPDTTVASCGNGVLDPGEDCDPAGPEEISKTTCSAVDAELYGDQMNAPCDPKWCTWDRNSCEPVEREFDCPWGYSGGDCKKCSSRFQDTDGNGTCEPSCFYGADSINDYRGGRIMCGHGVIVRACEYYDGKAYCSCASGWLRDDAGACTICDPDNPSTAKGCEIPCPQSTAGDWKMCDSATEPQGGTCYYNKNTGLFTCACANVSDEYDESSQRCYPES